MTGSPLHRNLPWRDEGLPGYWAVLFARAVVEDPAEFSIPSPLGGNADVAFRLNETLGTRDDISFVAAWPTAHTLAYLRIAGRVSTPGARLATDPGGLTPGRTGFAPAGRHTKFHEVIAFSIPPRPALPGRTIQEIPHGRVSIGQAARRIPAATGAGKTYLAYASEALQRLRAGDAALADPARRTRVLTVSVSPSFAAKWLVPRLGEFTAVCQDIDLRISANPKHVDFIDDEIDLAVRHGDGNWPHLHCVRLCTESMFPVCSPSLRNSRSLANVGDLANFQLIHHAKRVTWSNWLGSFGVGDLPNCDHGPIFNEMSLAIDAAIAGQGIALARTALVARDLVDGRLIRPLKESLPADFSYWIVWPKAASGSSKIERFTKWLLDQSRHETLLMRDQPP